MTQKTKGVLFSAVEAAPQSSSRVFNIDDGVGYVHESLRPGVDET